MGDGNKKQQSEEIWVNEFTEVSAQKFRDEMTSRAKANPNVPIVIYIDSYGGYVDSLAKMIETMDEIPNPKVTVCMGKAMSCGAILLSHGDVRYCGKHSRVMVHEVSSMTWGDVHDMATDADETKRLNKHFMNLLAKNSGYKGYDELRKIIKNKDGRNMYMSAEQAVKFGISDYIGTPSVTTITLHDVSVLQASSRKSPLKKTAKRKTKKKTKKKRRKSKK